MSAERKTLTDEKISELYSLYRYTDGISFADIVRTVEQAVLQSDEVQAWKKDAGRYRWLREHPLDGLEETTPCIRAAGDDPGHWALNGEAADAAIDAAMEKQP